MIFALAEGKTVDLSVEEQGELQAKMLELGGEAAANDRVEIIARVAISRANGEDSPRPDRVLPQLFIIDALGEIDDEGRDSASFGYERGRRGDRPGCELSLNQFRFEPGQGSRTAEFLDDEGGVDRALEMLKRALEVTAGVGPFPRHPEEKSDNPIMGNGYGSESFMVRPRQLFPFMGRVMAVGGRALLAAGDRSAAEVRLDINAGAQIYGPSSSYESQSMILWVRNDEGSADFGLNLRALAGGRGFEQIAFADVQGTVDEYGVGGKLRRTRTKLIQEGEGLVLRSMIKHGDDITREERPASLDTIVEMAQQVERLTA